MTCAKVREKENHEMNYQKFYERRILGWGWVTLQKMSKEKLDKNKFKLLFLKSTELTF